MTYQIKREQRIALAIAEQFCQQWDLLPKVKRNHFRFANAGEPTLLTENCIDCSFSVVGLPYLGSSSVVEFNTGESNKQIKEKVVNTYLDLFKDYKAEFMLNGKIFGFCPQKATMKQFKAAEKYLKLIVSKVKENK